jgi:hypothetical protein
MYSYSYSYKISLDGITRTITSNTDDYLEEEDLKLDAFIHLYEKETNKFIEWERVQDEEQAEENEEMEWYPLHYSQLRGETLEAFNRMEFELLSLSKNEYSKPKRKKKSFWDL